MKTKKNTKLWEWQTRCKEGTEKCAKCGDTRTPTVDHIVSVNILQRFVQDSLWLMNEYEANFQILCRYCNYMKSDRLDPKNPKTYEVLEEAIARAKAHFIQES